MGMKTRRSARRARSKAEAPVASSTSGPDKRAPKDKGVGGYQVVAVEDVAAHLADRVPSLISLPAGGRRPEELLQRTNTRSTPPRPAAITTTEKMHQAVARTSSETGVVNGVTILSSSTKLAESPRRIAKQRSTASSSDASTLPTFLSVGESVPSSPEVEVVAGDALFFISRGEVDGDPLVRPLSSEDKPRKVRVSSRSRDPKTKKRLHYREQLRSLAEKVTTHQAVERSKEMFTYILENGKIVGEADNSIRDEEASAANERCPPGPGLLEGLKKKLIACSSRLCLDEAIVDHSGLVIKVPSRDYCRCVVDEALSEHHCPERNASDVSSLTGETPHRYVSRYWLRRSTEQELSWV